MLSGRLPRGVNPVMLAAMAAMQRGQSQAFRGEERYLPMEPMERGWDSHNRGGTDPCSVETCTGPPSILPGRELSRCTFGSCCSVAAYTGAALGVLACIRSMFRSFHACL